VLRAARLLVSTADARYGGADAGAAPRATVREKEIRMARGPMSAAAECQEISEILHEITEGTMNTARRG
jgi:hypothetical protein